MKAIRIRNAVVMLDKITAMRHVSDDELETSWWELRTVDGGSFHITDSEMTSIYAECRFISIIDTDPIMHEAN